MSQLFYMSRHLKDPIGTGNPATAILLWKPFNSAKMEIHVVRYKRRNGRLGTS